MTQAFVYYWQELSTNKWYIGSRTRKDCHLNDGYICSSKIVRPLIQKNPNNWKRTIIAIGDFKDILNFEITLLKAMDAKNDIMSYNQHNGKGDFTNTNRSMSEEQKLKISKKLKGKKKGPLKESTRKKLRQRIHSPEIRYKMSQAHIGIPKGPPSEKTRKKISQALKGRILSEETRRKMSESHKRRQG